MRTGKALTANRSGPWRYRIGDYRLISEILDEKVVFSCCALAAEAIFTQNSRQPEEFRLLFFAKGGGAEARKRLRAR